MRAFILFLLSCVSVLGADGDIQVYTTATTITKTASVVQEVYTRDGQTNLVRRTDTEAGVVRFRIHQFYHAGTAVGQYVAVPQGSSFTTEAGTPYRMSLECDASRNPQSLIIGTKDVLMLDRFTCTNGVFSPVQSSLIHTNLVRELQRAMEVWRKHSKQQ